MTVRWTVRAALTEERSKAEIKNSALRCRDENRILVPQPKGKGVALLLSFLFFSFPSSAITALLSNKASKTDFAKRNFARQGKASEEDEDIVTYVNSDESML